MQEGETKDQPEGPQKEQNQEGERTELAKKPLRRLPCRMPRARAAQIVQDDWKKNGANRNWRLMRRGSSIVSNASCRTSKIRSG